MSRRVVVSGIGLMTAVGCGAPTTWQSLVAGRSGLCLGQPFSALPPRPLGLIGDRPQDLAAVLMPAVSEAIADARLPLPQPDCGVVIGSSRSFQGRWERLTPAANWTETPWLETLPHMGAIAVARYIQASGPVLAPMAACTTGLMAIFQGFELIRQGQCDRVLVGAAEAPITPLTLAGFEQLGALAPNGCYPFAADREGLALGEGAAILVLEAEAALNQRSGPQPYGYILGGGFSADAHHRTAPDPALGGSRLALKNCLHHSGLKPEQVGYVHGHGTGTRLNDAHEVQLLSQGFSSLPWMSSTKGATGHTLGASGAIGAAVCLLALRHRLLPPNVGDRGESIYPNLVRPCPGIPRPDHPNPNVSTVSGGAAVYGLPRLHPGQAALCFSFGFGGQNGVLALGSEAQGLSSISC